MKQFITPFVWVREFNEENKSIDIRELWKEYHEHGLIKERLFRSAKNTVWFMMFAWVAEILTDTVPGPTRGIFAYCLDLSMAVTCSWMMVYLTMFIGDAVRLYYRFIGHLEKGVSHWPGIVGMNLDACYLNPCGKEAELLEAAQKWGLTARCTSYWLDVQFVARRTEFLQKYLWYALIPLLLLVAALSPVFDDWTHSLGLILAITLLVVYLFSCAYALEHGAKQMRKKALCELNEELTRWHVNCIEDKKVAQLERMIKEIEELKRGAFLPLSQQPWLQALLTLASGAGGLTWLGQWL